MNAASKISDLIGKTPLLRLNRLNEGLQANIYLKLENMNPGGSVKDRLALAMVNDAEEKGLIDNDTLIVEATSGNTGIGLAMICAERNYKLILTMPENMSVERRSLLQAFGAEIVLTPANEGMNGSIKKAEDIFQQHKNSFIPQQFMNPVNPEIHRLTTATEIWNDTEGAIDVFVAAAGTGGTITGISEALKMKKSELFSVVVEPADSAVLSGEEPGSHPIQGIGAGFIPKVLNTNIYDEVFIVKNEDAFETARKLAKHEGVLTGISSGANVFAALELAKRPENKNKNIVVIICDTGERYLSSELFKIL